MDDVVWWAGSREAARATLGTATAFAREDLLLDVKQPVQIGRSAGGLSFCGYRVLPRALLLSRRRRKRYAQGRGRPRVYATGEIDAKTLQAGYASAVAITAHANAAAWRREQLRRRPLEADLERDSVPPGFWLFDTACTQALWEARSFRATCSPWRKLATWRCICTFSEPQFHHKIETAAGGGRPPSPFGVPIGVSEDGGSSAPPRRRSIVGY